MKSAMQMFMESKLHCNKIAEGQYSPVIFCVSEWFDGSVHKYLGYRSTTITGYGCTIFVPSPKYP